MTSNQSIYFEYTTAAVPTIDSIQPTTLAPLQEETIITPNLKAKYLNFNENTSKKINTQNSSSNVFYVIKGSGEIKFIYENATRTIHWDQGDVFIIPFQNDNIYFKAFHNSTIFYANDSSLIEFLNCKPTGERFSPCLYKKDEMMAEIEKHNNMKDSGKRNRNGVLLTNSEMVIENLNTITHTMWSLMNTIPPNTVQKPHRHNSIAIDLCSEMEESSNGLVYTLMSKEIDENGNLINPIRMDWKKHHTFTTPPGWWHSHHNESEYPAWVFPVQDAGLHTYLRTLDIQFVK
jgi:gentisate 1,2-dioxygenase